MHSAFLKPDKEPPGDNPAKVNAQSIRDHVSQQKPLRQQREYVSLGAVTSTAGLSTMVTHPTPAKNPPAQKGAAQESTAAAAAATPASVISLKAMFEQLGETHGLPKKQAQVLQADLVTALVTHLKPGARIRMSGLGTLEVRHRAARTGRNPATGEAIEIQASKKIAFRPAKELKEAV
ncbi:MAG TPA: HU family DNA-binding protein [Rhodopila sp.]|nr:HU family DNA-binding protein [Rhodopila sp.]